MTDKPATPRPAPKTGNAAAAQKDALRARQAEALRANLRRRKAAATSSGGEAG